MEIERLREELEKKDALLLALKKHSATNSLALAESSQSKRDEFDKAAEKAAQKVLRQEKLAEKKKLSDEVKANLKEERSKRLQEKSEAAFQV